MMQSLVERLERLEESEGRVGRTRYRSGHDRDSKEPVNVERKVTLLGAMLQVSKDGNRETRYPQH